MPALRVVRRAAAIAAALLLARVAVLLVRLPPGGILAGPSAESPVSSPSTGASMRFSLVDSAGRPVTEASYHGRWALLYFGYAFCPDVCPTALQAIAAALDDLGPAASQVAALFVTIDPARDTPAALAQYVRLFDDSLIGLTGDAAQIEAAEHQFDIRILNVTKNGPGDYSLLHSSSIYLLSPAGRLDTVFPAGTDAEALGAALAARVAAGDREG